MPYMKEPSLHLSDEPVFIKLGYPHCLLFCLKIVYKFIIYFVKYYLIRETKFNYNDIINRTESN